MTAAGDRPALALEDRLVLAATIALPWAYGGVAPWASRSAAALLAAAAGVSLVRSGWAGVGLGRGSRWLYPAVLLGVWAVLQLVPLPGAVVSLVSPRAGAIHRATFPDRAGRVAASERASLEDLALAEVPELHGVPLPQAAAPRPLDEPAGRWSGPRPLSLVPEAGWERVHWFLALLLAFGIVERRAADASVAVRYRRALFCLFVALAAYGIVHAWFAEGTLYGGRRTIESSRPFAPYVNPTHFAGVMELAVPWLAGAAIDALARARRAGASVRGAVGRFAATALCLSAGLATASKAAPLLLGASLAALALLTARSGRGLLLRIGALAVVVPIAVLGARMLDVGERVEELFATTGRDPSQIDRVVVWRAALPMLRDFAVAGCGYGAFGDVFPAYLPAGEQHRWEQLHNDFLEAAIAGGLVGAGLLSWLVVGYGRRLAHGMLQARKRGDASALGLGLGLAALTAHALVDFNHQIPANALLFVVLAALALRSEPMASP